jgi:hypothetical protein
VNRDLAVIDEHAVLTDADPLTAWGALVATLEATRRARSRAFFARVLGCRETSANALPLKRLGATTPGFRVVESVPLARLTLRGRHRFSEYALEFECEVASAAKTAIRARTRANFPGPSGWVYRQLVIGSRAHTAAVKSTLNAVKRCAEESLATRTEVAAT